jgi:hypothetical protein
VGPASGIPGPVPTGEGVGEGDALGVGEGDALVVGEGEGEGVPPTSDTSSMKSEL